MKWIRSMAAVPATNWLCTSRSVATRHHRRTAAIDEQLRTRNEIGLVGGEKQHRPRKIDRLARPITQIDHFAVGVEFVLSHWRADLVRYDAIHAYIVRRKLNRE